MRIRTKFIGVASVLAAVFLIGFIPEYLKSRRLEGQLEASRTALAQLQRQTEIDGLRNLAGRMLLQTLRQNYGFAGDLAAEYFRKADALAKTAEEPSLKKGLNEVLGMRNTVTTALSHGDPSSISLLQMLLERTYDLPDAGRP